MDIQRRRALFSGVDDGAHAPQGLGHALHRPPGQRFVTRQDRIKGLPRQKAGEQAHGGAGIPQVQCLRRRLQTVQTDAVNGDPAIDGTLDDHAHGLESLHRRETILRLQKTADTGRTLGQRAQHDGTMRNGLVARNPRLAPQSAAGLNLESDLVVIHDDLKW